MLTEQQIQARKAGVGASESSAILCLNRYCSPYKLWLLKTGRAEAEKLEDNESLWYGNAMEPIIAARYELDTGCKLISDPTTFVNPDNELMLAHPDRFVEGENKLIEIKTAWYDPNSYGEVYSDQVPREYYLQCQHQMACCPGYDEVELVVFFWNLRRVQCYTIKRDIEAIAMISNAVTKFWQDHIIADVAPSLETIEDCEIAHPRNVIEDCKDINIMDPVYSNVEKYISARSWKKEAETWMEDYKQQLCVEIGDHSGLRDGDKIICTWKANKNGKRSFVMKGDK